MAEMEKSTLKELIEWMDEQNDPDEKILDCIRRMVGAHDSPRKEPPKE